MALTAAEQYLLELINRARLDPVAEAARLGVDLNQGLAAGTIRGQAQQVLAHDSRLETSAQDHSAWMLAADVFSHTGAGGSSATQRMQEAGYCFGASAGEARCLPFSTTYTPTSLVGVEPEFRALCTTPAGITKPSPALTMRFGLPATINSLSPSCI